MHKLIIVLIAIIVSAAAAAAGVYYGGDALSGGAAKAHAQTVLSGLEQIASTAQVYTNENGGTKPASISTLVTAKYLNQAPTPPSSVTNSYGIVIDGGNGYAYLDLGANAETMCLEIAKMADGSTTTLATTTNAGTIKDVAAFNTTTFTCATSSGVDTDGDGEADFASGNEVAVFRF